MKIKSVLSVKAKAEARQIAIDWQHSHGNKAMYLGDRIEWENYFMVLGKKFGLKREFKENGIL